MKIIRSESFAAVRHGWVALALFAAVVAIFGGSSRFDAIQLAALRPLAALFLIPAIYFYARDRVADFRTPLILLLLLVAWMAIQLIPLPPSIWQALPGRGPEAEMGAALGMNDIWRPISMVPSRTLNALASLVVPITGFLLVASLGASRRTLIILIVAIGSANAALGLLQIVGGNPDPLYFYEITNRGSPVGFFANHNHSAVLSALTLVAIAYSIAMPEMGFSAALPRIGLGALFLLVLLSALVGGSRAGLLTMVLALLASGFLLWLAVRVFAHKRIRHGGQTEIRVQAKWILALAAVAIVGIVAVFISADRIPALERVAASGSFEDLRWGLLPTLGTMILSYGLLGSGFGSFEEVYHIHEPDSLMISSYVNMAHNDWAQLLIEGGIPAIAILALFCFWLVRTLASTPWSGPAGFGRLVFWLSVGAIIAFGSLVDYPLRAPLFQLVAIWLVALLCVERATFREGR